MTAFWMLDTFTSMCNEHSGYYVSMCSTVMLKNTILWVVCKLFQNILLVAFSDPWFCTDASCCIPKYYKTVAVASSRGYSSYLIYSLVTFYLIKKHFIIWKRFLWLLRKRLTERGRNILAIISFCIKLWLHAALHIQRLYQELPSRLAWTLKICFNILWTLLYINALKIKKDKKTSCWTCDIQVQLLIILNITTTYVNMHIVMMYSA